MSIELWFTKANSKLKACYSLKEAYKLSSEVPATYAEIVKRYGIEAVQNALKEKQQAVTQQLITDGWTYIPQFGSHAGHFVSPTWAAKHEIPSQPDASDVVAYADWIVELRLFSAIYDQDLKEEDHLVYFP